MKKALLTAVILALSPYLSFAQNLRIDIRGDLRGPAKVPVFHGELLLQTGQPFEVFTGPYTLKLTARKDSTAQYKLAAELFGLGPDFMNFRYNLPLRVNDPMIIPPVPVRGQTTVKFTFLLMDDTSSYASAEAAESDTALWGISESVHYRTHWLRNSLADFMWNSKMGYLEEVYNRYRESFRLSSSQKIDLYFHPLEIGRLRLIPPQDYVIRPRTMRIDVLYNHDIDAADPRPAAELMLYKQWGYGPRWMVAGMAGYYLDNLLRVRNYVEKLNAARLANRFGDESWVASDTGREITGGFVHWLLDIEDVGSFMNLYRQATSADHQKVFMDIYGRSLESAIHEFIDYMERYKPRPGELGYYASLCLENGDYVRARGYYQELAAEDRNAKESDLKSLAKCEFWLGDYVSAESTGREMIQVRADPSCDDKYFLVDMAMAAGEVESATKDYRDLYQNGQCEIAGLELASILMDNGDIEKAAAIIGSLTGGITNTPDYMIAAGRLKMLLGQSADSLLMQVAAINLTRAQTIPQDPMNFYMAGRAFSLMGQLDKAKENLQIAYFLDRRPYFIALTLLELGRVDDLRGKREDAVSYYNQVISMNAGAYQKLLAEKYLENEYINGH